MRINERYHHDHLQNARLGRVWKAKNYYWNEYRREGDTVVKYKCKRRKFFDGDESNWEESEQEEDSWSIDDSNMPDWLRSYL